MSNLKSQLMILGGPCIWIKFDIMELMDVEMSRDSVKAAAEKEDEKSTI